MPSDLPRITVYVEQTIKNSLEELAKTDDRSLSYYVGKVLEEHVNFQQSSQAQLLEDGELAIACWQKVALGEMPTPREITLLCAVLDIPDYRRIEALLMCIAKKGRAANGL